MKTGDKGGVRGAALAWRIWRAEGVRAVAARAADRVADARRRRSFRPATAPPPGFRAPVLNIAAAAPSPRLGGVQAQLLWRLAEESKLRPIALLYPACAARGSAHAAPGGVPDIAQGGAPHVAPGGARGTTTGGFRLELQWGEERRALDLWGAPPAQGTKVPVPLVAEARLAQEDTVPSDACPATALDDPSFEAAIAWAAAACGVEALHVEGLAGMPLASLLRLRGGGLRLILSVHDFAAFCPRPHLLEMPPPPAAPGFCHYSRDAARCAACLAVSHPRLPPGYQEERRALAGRLLAAADMLVYPSAFLARRHAELFAGGGPVPTATSAVLSAGAGRARIIAPGIPAGCPEERQPPPAPPPRAAARARRPLHAAWVGAVLPHKGALVFEAAARALGGAPRPPRLTVLGGGDAAILCRWRRLPGVRVRGYYRTGSLPALLRREGVDVALLLSVVPESHGLALDECAAAGVPAVAFALGALGERLAAGSPPPETPAGPLLLDAALAADPAAAGAALAALLRDLQEGRRALPPPAGPPAERAPAAAQRWLDLYRGLGLVQPPVSASATARRR